MSDRRKPSPATFSDSVNGVYTLAPQTTPYSYAPTATAATAGAGKCNSRSVFCFTTAGQLTKGYACDLVDRIGGDDYQYLDDDCYPPHYDLINHGDPNLDRTVAYPGTACPAGFTPACTTTLALTNPAAKTRPYTGILTQTWCCPSGSIDPWVCTDRDQSPQQPTSRLCVSLLAGSTATNVWFSADPAVTTSKARSSYTTSAVGPEISIRVLRAAFPLGEVQQDVLRGLVGLPSATTNETAVVATSSGSTTSPGMIAGIVIGCLALLGFIAVGLYLCARYRRESKEEREEQLKVNLESAAQPLGEKGTGSTGAGANMKPEEEEIVELPGLPAPVVPPPYGRLSEMSADSGVAELPADRHTSNMARER